MLCPQTFIKTKRLSFIIMKQMILAALFMILLIFLTSCTAPLPSEEELTRCNADEECILIGENCCSCTTSGDRVSINKKYLDLWKETYLKECDYEGYSCLATESTRFICHSEPKCIEKKCGYTPKMDYLKDNGPVIWETGGVLSLSKDEELDVSFVVINEDREPFRSTYPLEYTVKANISQSKNAEGWINLEVPEGIFKNKGILVHEIKVTKGTAKVGSDFLIKVTILKIDGSVLDKRSIIIKYKE